MDDLLILLSHTSMTQFIRSLAQRSQVLHENHVLTILLRTEPRTAISILISSNFLQMAALEEVTLKYVHDNINEIIKGAVVLWALRKQVIG